jgi:hypothetical protein
VTGQLLSRDGANNAAWNHRHTALTRLQPHMAKWVAPKFLTDPGVCVLVTLSPKTMIHMRVGAVMNVLGGLCPCRPSWEGLVLGEVARVGRVVAVPGGADNEGAWSHLAGLATLVPQAQLAAMAIAARAEAPGPEGEDGGEGGEGGRSRAYAADVLMDGLLRDARMLALVRLVLMLRR